LDDARNSAVTASDAKVTTEQSRRFSVNKTPEINLTQHFIGGRFVDSRGREEVDIQNPATGELIGRALLGDEVDSENAISAATAAFPSWSRTTLDERKAHLQRLADAVTERFDDLKARARRGRIQGAGEPGWALALPAYPGLLLTNPGASWRRILSGE
jgi:delta 1-pyrroline-5-carboxylate dehydrogenase